MVLHWRLHRGQNPCFKVSHLRYAVHPYTQYQTTVKLLGSFRLAAGRRHLHRPCIFTEQVPETVPNSLYHSCASELHVFPAISSGMDYIFILDCSRSQRVVSTGSMTTSLGIIFPSAHFSLKKRSG